MPSACTRSLTGRSPPARTSRICRRRGSATALNASAVVAARAMPRLYVHIGICQRAAVHPKRVMPPGRAASEARCDGSQLEGRASMFVRRRRPLARAAMVGGAAYYAGKKGQQASQREEEQEYRLQQLEQQQYAQPEPQYAPPPPPAPVAAAPPPAPAAGGISDDTIAQLEKLGQLKSQGILTEEEFNAQKSKLLGLS